MFGGICLVYCIEVYYGWLVVVGDLCVKYGIVELGIVGGEIDLYVVLFCIEFFVDDLCYGGGDVLVYIGFVVGDGDEVIWCDWILDVWFEIGGCCGGCRFDVG